MFDDSDDNIPAAPIDARTIDMPNNDGRSSRRKMESFANGIVNFTDAGSILPQKRKRKTTEKDKGKDKEASAKAVPSKVSLLFYTL